MSKKQEDDPKPRFRLTEAHYAPGDIHLPAGTVIGEETAYPLSLWEHKDPKTKKEMPFVPSVAMEPLDDEAQKLIDDNPSDGPPEEGLSPTVSGPIEPPKPVDSTGAGTPGKRPTQLPNGKEPNKDSAPKDG